MTGDTNLDPDVVQTYFKTMDNVKGFNGYAPGFTFANQNNHALFRSTTTSSGSCGVDAVNDLGSQIE